MSAVWAVTLTLEFLGTLTAGDIGLAIAFGVLLAADLLAAALLQRTARLPMTSWRSGGECASVQLGMPYAFPTHANEVTPSVAWSAARQASGWPGVASLRPLGGLPHDGGRSV